MATKETSQSMTSVSENAIVRYKRKLLRRYTALIYMLVCFHYSLDTTSPPATTPPPKCGDGEYQCVADYRCIPWDKLCDERPDCSDGSDEINEKYNPCGETRPVMNVWTEPERTGVYFFGSLNRTGQQKLDPNPDPDPDLDPNPDPDPGPDRNPNPDPDPYPYPDPDFMLTLTLTLC